MDGGERPCGQRGRDPLDSRGPVAVADEDHWKGVDLARLDRRRGGDAPESVADRTRAPYSGRMPTGQRLSDDRGVDNAVDRALNAVRAVLVTAVLGAMVLVGAGPAAADEPGESTVASELVRQAIALIVNTDDMEAVREKVGDALEVENREGVDIALVRQADEALAAGDMHEGRTLLEESIGARPHLGSSDVAAIREVSEDETARGAEAGEAPILDPLDTGGLDGGDVAAIAAGAALMLAGALLAWRWRPSRAREA